jgi:hypothetical protein
MTLRSSLSRPNTVAGYVRNLAAGGLMHGPLRSIGDLGIIHHSANFRRGIQYPGRFAP